MPGSESSPSPGAVELLMTPVASEGEKANISASRRRDQGRQVWLTGQIRDLMPTPSASVANDAENVGNWEERRERLKAKGINGNGMGMPLSIAAQKAEVAWGPYEPAIRRWEAALGRPAPAPTEPNRNGNPGLSPRFTEWMMGVPDGWVTDISLSRSALLRALGNGVVPQQATSALIDMRRAFEERT